MAEEPQVVLPKVTMRDLKSPRDFSLFQTRERDDQGTVEEQFRNADKEFRFREADFAVASGVKTADFNVIVTNATAVENTFADALSVTVTDNGGSASGRVIVTTQPVSFKKLETRTNGVLSVEFVAKVTVTVTSTGTFTLGLTDSAGENLTTTDLLTITFP